MWVYLCVCVCMCLSVCTYMLVSVEAKGSTLSVFLNYFYLKFLKIFIPSIYVCVCICMSVCYICGCPWRQKRMSDLLQLELQAV